MKKLIQVGALGVYAIVVYLLYLAVIALNNKDIDNLIYHMIFVIFGSVCATVLLIIANKVK